MAAPRVGRQAGLDALELADHAPHRPDVAEFVDGRHRAAGRLEVGVEDWSSPPRSSRRRGRCARWSSSTPDRRRLPPSGPHRAGGRPGVHPRRSSRAEGTKCRTSPRCSSPTASPSGTRRCRSAASASSGLRRAGDAAVSTHRHRLHNRRDRPRPRCARREARGLRPDFIVFDDIDGHDDSTRVGTSRRTVTQSTPSSTHFGGGTGMVARYCRRHRSRRSART